MICIFPIFGNTLSCEVAPLYKGMSENSKKLVVEISKDMGASSDRIESEKIEDYIINSEVAWTYLKEGDLLPFMEGMGGYDEHVSLQFFDT